MRPSTSRWRCGRSRAPPRSSTAMQSWGVLDCICRKQKALIGQACKHPIDVCLAMDPHPQAFDGAAQFRAPEPRDEAMATLRRAAEAGLVHTVTNTVEGTSYICNCCTCSCGILRGMAELGIANVVASSPFVNTVQEVLCTGLRSLHRRLPVHRAVDGWGPGTRSTVTAAWAAACASSAARRMHSCWSGGPSTRSNRCRKRGGLGDAAQRRARHL